MEMDKGQGFRSQRGSAVTSVAALVGLVGLLYVVYINLQVTGEQATKGMETKAVSQGVACMSNRQAIGLSITTWSVHSSWSRAHPRRSAKGRNSHHFLSGWGTIHSGGGKGELFDSLQLRDRSRQFLLQSGFPIQSVRARQRVFNASKAQANALVPPIKKWVRL